MLLAWMFTDLLNSTLATWSFTVCVCVKTPRNRVKEFSNFKEGAGEGGGVSPANEDTPPHPVQTYLHCRISVL